MALVIGIHAEGIIILQYLRYFCDADLLSTIGPPTRFVFPIFSHVFLSIVAIAYQWCSEAVRTVKLRVLRHLFLAM